MKVSKKTLAITALDSLATIAYFCRHATKGVLMEKTIVGIGSLIDGFSKPIRNEIEGGVV